jgi:DNA gyrase subunit B
LKFFHSDEGLKEYIRYLDVNREPLLHMLFPWINEEEIPVEVA